MEAADYKIDIEVDDQISLESIVVEPFIFEETHEQDQVPMT